MGKLLISYRRSDSEDATGRISDHLVRHFHRQNVFKDVDSVAVGQDYRQQIEDAINQCDVVLVVIGRTWLDARDAQGRRRLDDPDDVVRWEIERALLSQVTIIPVLVQGARMPDERELPESIRRLARINAAVVRAGRDFEQDMRGLIREIGRARRRWGPAATWLVVVLLLAGSIGWFAWSRWPGGEPGAKPKPAPPPARPKVALLRMTDVLVDRDSDASATLDLRLLNDGSRDTTISRVRLIVRQYDVEKRRDPIQYTKVYDADADLSQLRQAGQQLEVPVAQRIAAGQADRFGIRLAANPLLENANVVARWTLEVVLVTSEGEIAWEQPVVIELTRPAIARRP